MNLPPSPLTEEGVARVLWDAQRPDADRIDFDRIDRVSMDGWLRMARAVLALVAREREECAKAVDDLDELKVIADWDNSDDIACEVKKACATAIRSRGTR